MKKKKQTLKDNFVEAYNNYKKKDYKTAENSCYKILSINPNHFDSNFLLATIYAVQNNFKKAKEFLLKANEIEPKHLSTLNNLGTACKELGENKESINYYNKILEINPNHSNANYNLGLVYYKMKELNKAQIYFEKTVQIQKNYAVAFFSLGNVYADLKYYNRAVSSYQKALEINPNILGALNNLGLVFRILNDFDNAVKCYEKVIKIKFDHVGAHHNLAMAFKELGEFKKAIKHHETSIKHEPENPIHYYYLSELKKDILDTNLKNKISKILKNKNTSKGNMAYGYYLLSKFENKIKNYKKEIDCLIKGHEEFFESKKDKFKLGVKYCFDDVLQISEGVNVDKLRNKDNKEIKPIFIIGVPRCGSTLVEKIIASGEKRIPMGEETSVLENFLNQKILEKQSLNLGDGDAIKKEITDIYMQKGLISEKNNYIFTDKSLNNFFYLNFIKSVFPDAKIINCKRNILSSIMSIFQNNLTELAWAHNLENIFKYFDNYFKIIENFKEDNPNYLYELDFEKLVNNPENQSKKLMQFCELPWDKKCLEFYKRKDLISKTASNIQIREAIYKHSLEKYLPYKVFLDKYGSKYLWFN